MLVLCLLCLAISLINSEVSNFRCGDPRVCYDEKGEKPVMIEVLPGFCWDNLVNENRGVVVNFNYCVSLGYFLGYLRFRPIDKQGSKISVLCFERMTKTVVNEIKHVYYS